jgi:hypothetical protein
VNAEGALKSIIPDAPYSGITSPVILVLGSIPELSKKLPMLTARTILSP